MEDFNSKKAKELFKEFGVKDEDELQKKLFDEALIFKCSVCGKEYDAEKLHFKGDIVICENCSVEDLYDEG